MSDSDGDMDAEQIQRMLEEQEEVRETDENKTNDSATDDANKFQVTINLGKNQFRETRDFLSEDDDISILRQAIVAQEGGNIKKLQLTANTQTLIDGHSLKYYRITSMTTVYMKFTVRGGAHDVNAHKKKERKRLARFKTEKRIKPTLKPDCIMHYDSKELRVKMPCGHVFAPKTIFQIVKRAAEIRKELNVSCPILKCRKVWDFDVVVAAGDLNFKERTNYGEMFHRRQSLKTGQYRECPGCEGLLPRPKDLKMIRVHCSAPACANKSDFCWVCSKPWKGGGFSVCGNEVCSTTQINKTLKNCGTTTKISGFSGIAVPAVRACPRCHALIQHDEACKHMKCWFCHESFCFVCLQLGYITGKNSYGGDIIKWNCKSSQCAVENVQTIK